MGTSSSSSDSELEVSMVLPTLLKRVLLIFGSRNGGGYRLTSLSFERAVCPVVDECPCVDITGGGVAIEVGIAGENTEATVCST